jgi:hypothetical protein
MGDIHAVLLAIAQLSISRPGWAHYLDDVVARLSDAIGVARADTRVAFEHFRKLHQHTYSGVLERPLADALRLLTESIGRSVARMPDHEPPASARIREPAELTNTVYIARVAGELRAIYVKATTQHADAASATVDFSYADGPGDTTFVEFFDVMEIWSIDRAEPLRKGSNNVG